jgi:hypothetical protein
MGVGGDQEKRRAEILCAHLKAELSPVIVATSAVLQYEITMVRTRGFSISTRSFNNNFVLQDTQMSENTVPHHTTNSTKENKPDTSNHRG